MSFFDKIYDITHNDLFKYIFHIGIDKVFVANVSKITTFDNHYIKITHCLTILFWQLTTTPQPRMLRHQLHTTMKIIMTMAMASDSRYSVLVNDTHLLKIVSYNLHGFHQGFPATEDLNQTVCPDVFTLQEHWVTPDNLSKFDRFLLIFFSFGCSAMTRSVEYGMICGRPFGGIITLVNNRLRKMTETVACDERFTFHYCLDWWYTD